MLKTILMAGALAAVLSGCRSDTYKEEQVCLDIIKAVAIDPKNVQVNNSRVVQGPGSIEDIEQLYLTNRNGTISPAIRNLLELYKKQQIEVLWTYISLDVTYDVDEGRIRDNALCTYLNYDDKTELTAITLQNTDTYSDQFMRFFMLRGYPKHLDSEHRIQ